MIHQIYHLNLKLNLVEIDDESRGTYGDDNINDNDDDNNNIKFKTSMIRSSLCDYSDW